MIRKEPKLLAHGGREFAVVEVGAVAASGMSPVILPVIGAGAGAVLGWIFGKSIGALAGFGVAGAIAGLVTNQLVLSNPNTGGTAGVGWSLFGGFKQASSKPVGYPKPSPTPTPGTPENPECDALLAKVKQIMSAGTPTTVAFNEYRAFLAEMKPFAATQGGRCVAAYNTLSAWLDSFVHKGVHGDGDRSIAPSALDRAHAATS